MSNAFLSCDWGTSSFRLRWIEDGRCIHETVEAWGCKVIYEESIAAGASAEVSRSAFYVRYLQTVLARWHSSDRSNSRSLPFVISGMASSSIGWKELPYASLPLKLDGSSLRYEILEWDQPDWIPRTYLISGAATDKEIMRGEETEAIGLLDQLPIGNRSVLILPGTHSKHLRIEGDAITGFRTYMTGELFDVLARHSILKATVDLAGLENSNSEALAAFDSGVCEARQSGLGASLFQARTRTILGKCSATDNAWFLSGVLIGAELIELKEENEDVKILLGGARSLRKLYARALETLEVRNWSEVTDEGRDSAVVRAHAKFLQRHDGYE